MQRRGFIKLAVAGVGIVLIPSLVGSCDTQQLAALDGWHGPDPTEQDIRLIVLSYALLAPNPHNKQPWIIDLKGPYAFDLYVDPERLLRDTDPPYRQIHISQGTFLENLSLAARHFGYDANIEYFPQGQYGNTTLATKPVAAITLSKAAQLSNDPLFEYIVKRQSNRRVFTTAALTDQQIKNIEAAVPTDNSHYRLGMTTAPERRKKLAEFAIQAMAIEVSDRRRNEESIAMFRFNDAELENHRDGFGAPQTGAAGLKKYLIENLFISRKAFLAENSSFGKQGIQGTRAQAESAAAFGWLITTSNSRLDQIEIGRIYNRLNLTATALGLAMQPMSQVLQEYSDMAALQKEFKQYLQVDAEHTVQMFFRLGVAAPTRHTARRKVVDLLMHTTTRQSLTNE